MITEDYVEKSTRLIEQCSRDLLPRVARLGGLAIEQIDETKSHDRKPIRIALHWEVDPKTGDYDLIRDE
jgi:hypothetical protein